MIKSQSVKDDFAYFKAMPLPPDLSYELLKHPGFYWEHEFGKLPESFEPFQLFIVTNGISSEVIPPFTKLLKSLFELSRNYFRPGECMRASVATSQVRALIRYSTLPQTTTVSLMAYPDLLSLKHQWISLEIPTQPLIAIDPAGWHNPELHAIVPYFGSYHDCQVKSIALPDSYYVYTHSTKVPPSIESRVTKIARKIIK